MPASRPRTITRANRTGTAPNEDPRRVAPDASGQHGPDQGTSGQDAADQGTAGREAPGHEAQVELISQPVTEVMSRPVFSVLADLLLVDVLAAMVGTGLRHLVVVDEADRCLGVIADRAVAAAWATDPSALSYLPVGRVLDRRPSLVGTEATVGDVARAMYTDGVDAVAVIDRTGSPVGMITGADLVALMALHVPAANHAGGPRPATKASPPSRATRPTEDTTATQGTMRTAGTTAAGRTARRSR
ncbi:MAG TPA: CBS domain-containing protein [Micromonosporaceae bacterium]